MQRQIYFLIKTSGFKNIFIYKGFALAKINQLVNPQNFKTLASKNSYIKAITLNIIVINH
jgi:hypothetical protein